MKIKRIFDYLIFFVFALFLLSCRTNSATKEQQRVVQQKEQQRKVSYRQYKKAYKYHINSQSPETKKRIKAQLKEQKKNYRKRGLTGRYKKTCVPD